MQEHQALYFSPKAPLCHLNKFVCYLFHQRYLLDKEVNGTSSEVYKYELNLNEKINDILKREENDYLSGGLKNTHFSMIYLYELFLTRHK